MKKVLITLVKLIVLVVLLGIFGIVGIVGYSEIQATKAKEHLIMEYDFTDWNVFAIKVTEYVYEKETDCSTLWFKKCTDNKELAKDADALADSLRELGNEEEAEKVHLAAKVGMA